MLSIPCLTGLPLLPYLASAVPAVVKRVFLINTPPLFSSVWGIVKRFMDDGEPQYHA